ncbi:MAG: molybdopterin-dependent oxidoreductase [Pseudomonadota bacterium]|nr:molybdopterin-dependent oxidoreductase [Pseudomonadota bacterium]
MATAVVNGRTVELPDDEDALLVDVLRDRLGLTGTKLVCGAGVCGACTVLIDGAAVVSCLTPAQAAAGKQITTIEGIGAPELHPMQRAFMAQDALQCGFCTPGFIVEAKAFYDEWRATRGAVAPSREEIAAAFAGHLCRCGAYDNIYRAVAEACAGGYDSAEKEAPRVEARAKATGAAIYTHDIRHAGQLEGLILRSPHARARVAALDLAAARKAPGVRAVVSLLDAGGAVTFVGDPVAAVAAVDLATARRALAAIEVRYEPLAAAIGAEAALAPGAAVVFPRGKGLKYNAGEGGDAPAAWNGNLRGPVSAFSLRRKAARNAIEAARAARDPLLVEGVFRTSAQQHNSLEPHVAVARFDGEELTVEVSTQSVSGLAGEIAKHFKLDPARVLVLAQHVGGGFGSKAALRHETIAAIELAKIARAPVRVAYSRHEELSVAGYRPAVELKIALLPARDGALSALSLTAYSDAGVAANSTVAGLARLIYGAPAKELLDYDVVSDLPPGSPFRGPGGPPMAFALEQAVDEAALRLNQDPIALRKRWDANPTRARLYDWAMGLDVWKARGAPSGEGRYRRGVGVAAGYWLYLWQTDTKAELAVEAGRLVASLAVQDIGTGTRTVIADTLAREFGLDPGEIEVRLGDSRLPLGPGSGGSRVTASIVPALLVASAKLKARLQAAARTPAPGANAPWRAALAASPDLSVSAGRPADEKGNIYGNASLLHEAGVVGRLFGWMLRFRQKLAVGAGAPSSVQVVEVEVDTWLGRVRVLRAWTGIAVGRLAAPALARNQAAGAFYQSMGHALYEGREIDARSGDVLSVNLDDYRTPGIGDAPPVEVHFEESGFEHVPGGSVGIGEVAAVPTPAAIANAVRHAIGARPQEIPIRPDRLLALLKGAAHVDGR